MRTFLMVLAAGWLLAAPAWAQKGASRPRDASVLPPSVLPASVLSDDEGRRSAAIAALRARGPAGLEVLFVLRDDLVQRRDAAAPADPERWTQLQTQVARLEDAIDDVGGQRYCSASRLYWFTDFEQAWAEAQRTGKPILSLRMLGLLTDELSCANSRFFRTTLYANQEISRTLREKFVLHWQSVRPVPRITIDFGDGRKIERTVTGNSAHYALTSDGQPIDALPGLYGPAAFLGWLGRVEHLAATLHQAGEAHRGEVLQAYHQRRLQQIDANWRADLTKAGLDDSLAIAATTDEALWRQVAALHAGAATLDAASLQLIRAQNPNALQAGRLAVTKARIEDPLVRLVANLQADIALDTVRNEYQLHRRVHIAFAAGQEIVAGVNPLNEWVYAELFLTPSSDPWLGLAPADTYTALPNGGVVVGNAGGGGG